MKIQPQTTVVFAFFILAITLCSQGRAQSKSDPLTAATVNELPVPQAWIEQVIRNNTLKGAQDTPDLRKSIKEELIGREVLAQEAQRLNLDKTAEVKMALELMRQNYLVEVLLNDYVSKNTLTDAAVRAEYERQVKVLAEQGDVQQYKPSLIVVQTEEEAKLILKQLQSGQAFEKLAQEKSIDPSKSAGGDLGWILPSQIAPAISNVMVNLAKGVVVNAPIQLPAGWVILKVEDKRIFKVPSFEDSKNQLRQTLTQQHVGNYVRKLRESAKIVQ